ncbi:kielin/chordin-like protein [Discoglossus pictus]
MCTAQKDSNTLFNMISCNPTPCNTECEEGYKYTKTDDQCCGTCVKDSCIMTMDDGSTVTLKLGEIWNPPNNKCSYYECNKTGDHYFTVSTAKECTVYGADQCLQGYKYTKMDDQCCGICEIDSCIMTIDNGSTITLQPGEIWNPPTNKCSYYECKKNGEQYVTLSIAKECTVYSADDCSQGYKYKQMDDQCCGICEIDSCIMTTDDGSTVTLQPGETWNSPTNKCSYYECKKTGEHFVTLSISKECTVYSENDCSQGYKYKKMDDQCCGICEIDSCIMTMDNNSAVILQASETWINNCQECLCKATTLTVECKPLTCADPAPVSCERNGFVAVQIQNPDQPCCLKNECRCNVSYCSNEIQSCPLGFTLVSELKNGDCCSSFTCVHEDVCVVDNAKYMVGSPIPTATDSCKQCMCTAQKDSNTLFNMISCNPTPCNTECEEGYKYTKMDDQCCGTCVKDSCIMTMDDGSTVTLKLGEIWNPPNNKCSYYQCNKTGDNYFTVSMSNECTVYSADQCLQGYKYKKMDDQCCGICEIDSCIMITDNGSTITLQPGEIWNPPTNKCSYYECKQNGEQYVTLSISKECTVYSADQCSQGYKYKKMDDQCCGICEIDSCIMTTDDGSTVTLQPGETWNSPTNKCSYFECKKTGEHYVTVSISKECTVYSEDDCSQGYKYKKMDDQCCGICEIDSCIMNIDNNSAVILQASETWINNCQECLCKATTLTVDCKPLTCADPAPVSCERNGFVAVQIQNPDQPCCLKNECRCNVNYCSNEIQSCPLGFTLVSELKNGDCCPSYTCVHEDVCVVDNAKYMVGYPIPTATDSCKQCMCTAQKDSKTLFNMISCNPIPCNIECEEGYKYTKMDDQCCGTCVKDSCIMTMDDGSTTTLKLGEIWNPPNNKCSYYQCNKTGDDYFTVSISNECTVYSADQCLQGYKYKKMDDQCCGICEIDSCIMTMDNGSTVTLQPGEIWNPPTNKCSYYECKQNGEQYVILSISKECTVYSADDCSQGYKYKQMDDQCCGICEIDSCIMTMDDNSTVTLQPGETWNPPTNKCSYYECKKTGEHFVTLSISKECTVYSADDCSQGYKYKKMDDQCCGICEIDSCIMNIDNNSAVILQASETWINNCQECLCKATTLTVDCKPLTCADPAPVSCERNGFVAVQIQNPDQPCCLKNECRCNVNYCSNEIQSCPLGFTLVSELKNGDCCSSFTCVHEDVCVVDNAKYMVGSPIPTATDSCKQCLCTAQKDSNTLLNMISCNPTPCNTECEEGFKYMKMDDQCCGTCVKDTCIMTMDNGTTVTLQLGETLNHPTNKCSYYECNKTGENYVTVSISKECTVYSADQCLQGYKYKKMDDQCCGICEIDSCIMTTDIGSTVTLQPGEIWNPPNNKCSYYECKKNGEQYVTLSISKECTVYSEDDCSQGYKYKKMDDQCCGICEIDSCIMTVDDNSTVTLQPGETWNPPTNKCSYYECKKTGEHYVTVSISKDCTVYSEDDCSQGYKYKKMDDQCCGICEIDSCIMTTDNGSTTTLQPGETWNPPTNKCSYYECKKTGEHYVTVSISKECTVYSEDDCSPGYKYKKIDDQCCGICEIDSCIMTTNNDSTVTLQPGEIWNPPTNKCSYYECTKTGENYVTVSMSKECTVYSADDCSLGYEYKKVEDECCGICKQVSCTMKMKDNTTKILKPDEIWTPPQELCLQYKCQQNNDQFVPVTMETTCPVLGCEIGFEYKTEPGECCGKCIPVDCTVKMDDNTYKTMKPGETYISPSDSCTTYACSDNYQVVTVQKTCPEFDPTKCVGGTIKMSADGCCQICEEASTGCQLLKQSTRIRTSTCESDQTVELSYCEGACKTSSIYSEDANTMEHTCSCCQEMKTSKREVELKCHDGTSSVYSYIYVDQCGCTSTECGQEPQTSQRQLEGS